MGRQRCPADVEGRSSLVLTKFVMMMVKGDGPGDPDQVERNFTAEGAGSAVVADISVPQQAA